ncbi:MAG: YhgE/Pip family protein [Clostridium sp.]
MKEKKKNNKKIWLLLILLGILLIPAFYGGMYLKSYWNDDTSYNKVPIAVVNLDTPYTKDGTTYNIGQEVENNLKTNTTLGWKFVNYNEAKEGLYGTKYYAMLVIPKNFSKDIANATTDGFKKPQIEFYQNEGKNFVFSEISGFGAQAVIQSVSESITKSTSQALVETLYKTKDGFKTASEGANTLANGLVKLNNGSIKLDSGANELKAGANSLNTGLDKLNSGANALNEGANKATLGSSKLQSGVTQLQNGTESLASGTQNLVTGSSKLSEGAKALQNGSNELVGGIDKLNAGTNKLQSGSTKVLAGASSLNSNMGKLSAGASTVQKGVEGMGEELKEVQVLLKNGDTKDANALLTKISEQNANLAQGATELNNGISKAASGANSLQSGVESLNNGITSINNGASSVKTGAEKLNSGVASISKYSSELNTGLISANEGANKLNAGASSLSDGAKALNSGLNSLQSGTSALSSGLNTASEGASKLNTGAISLSTGTSALNNGLSSAKDGASKLNTGLSNGYNTLNNGLTFTAENMSNFIKAPVSLNTIAINKVNSYGEGFAPYFMCIGLWVGAMYAYFMVSSLSRRFEGSFKKRFLKMYIIGGVMCIVQAIIMSLIVQFGLGLNPTSISLFYLINILTSIAIFSLMNGLHYIAGSLMKALLIILMVGEFTSCGGSYPVAMMPALFKVISKFSLLTYSVGAMRMTISGINHTVFNHYILILISSIIVTTLIGYLIGFFRNYKLHKRVLGERSDLIGKDEVFNQYV